MKKESNKIEKIVPDTSVLIAGIVSDMIERGELQEAEIIVPEFVVEELRAQASKGRDVGFKGLEEIKKLRKMENDKIVLKKTGRRQTYEEIQLAKYGRIDALILDVAKELGAVLYTSDMVQALVAEADGVRTKFFPPYEKKKETKINSMITPDTMSLHLKEGTVPLAKRGRPGIFSLVKIREEPLTTEELEEIIVEIMDAARYEDDTFVEMGGHMSSVVQMGDMRIAIARPPFSDGIEITVVRPIKKLALDDYNLSKKMRERLEKNAEGIIIAGPPGSGKSTFAAALGEFYESMGKIVKTMESPRDLQVRNEITQYTKLRGSFENTADMMLLVRPDYTIFDEVRKTPEFVVFSDMRLAGIGMIGVVHATNPVDAVHRFIGRIELGLIPHVLDTIIYIKNGRIEKVYNLALSVRTPSGMTEADLARPLVEVRDFETDELEYEIYTYGEETVIIPIGKGGEKESSLRKLAKKQILSEMRRFGAHVDIEFVSDGRIVMHVDNDSIAKIIGKKGETIKKLEEKLGVSIDILPKTKTLGRPVLFGEKDSGAGIILSFRERMHGKIVNFYSGEDYLFSATVGKKNQVRVDRSSDIGKSVLAAILNGRLRAFV
jgi:ATPase